MTEVENSAGALGRQGSVARPGRRPLAGPTPVAKEEEADFENLHATLQARCQTRNRAG